MTTDNVANVIGTGVFLKTRVMTCNVDDPLIVMAVPTTPEVELRMRGGGSPGPATRTRIVCLPKAGTPATEVAEARPAGNGARR